MDEETPLFIYNALAPLGDCSVSSPVASDVFEDLEGDSETGLVDKTESRTQLHQLNYGTLQGVVSSSEGEDKQFIDVETILGSDTLHSEGLDDDAEEIPFISLESSDLQRPGNEVQRDEVGAGYLPLDLEEGEVFVSDEHFQSLQTAKVEKKIAPSWTPLQLGGISRIRSPILQLHQEIVNFCEFIAPTQEEKQERVEAIQRISDVIKSIWPHCSVKVFGSSATGLFLPSSDVDVVVLESGCDKAQNGLKALATVLGRKSLVKNMQVIGKARVPIIKFVEVQSKIAFDISFDVVNGPDAAEFIKEAIETLPPLKPLCMVLKIFLQQRELNEVYTGGLGSYALLVMLLTHLQMHPSRHVQSNFGNRLALEDNLGVLLVDFLDLYGRALNMRDVGISCRDGGRFFAKKSRGFVDSKRPHLLSVEDPQAPDNDIGKNSFSIQKVRSAFILAHRLLTSSSPDKGFVTPGILGRIVRLDSYLVGRKVPGLSKSLQFSGNEDQGQKGSEDYEQDRWLGDGNEAPSRQTGAELSRRARKRQRQNRRRRNGLGDDLIENGAKEGHSKGFWMNNCEEDFPRGGFDGSEHQRYSLERKKRENRKRKRNAVDDGEERLGGHSLLTYKEKFSKASSGNGPHLKLTVLGSKQKRKVENEQVTFKGSDVLVGSGSGGPYRLGVSDRFAGESKDPSRKGKRDKKLRSTTDSHVHITSSSRGDRSISKAISDHPDRDYEGSASLSHKGKSSVSKNGLRNKGQRNNEHVPPPMPSSWQQKQIKTDSVRGKYRFEKDESLDKSVAKVPEFFSLYPKRRRELEEEFSGSSGRAIGRFSKKSVGASQQASLQKRRPHGEVAEVERNFHFRRVMKTPSHTKIKYF